MMPLGWVPKPAWQLGIGLSCGQSAETTAPLAIVFVHQEPHKRESIFWSPLGARGQLVLQIALEFADTMFDGAVILRAMHRTVQRDDAKLSQLLSVVVIT